MRLTVLCTTSLELQHYFSYGKNQLSTFNKYKTLSSNSAKSKLQICEGRTKIIEKYYQARHSKKNILSESYIVIWNALLIVWMYFNLADDSKTEPSVIRKTAIDQTLAKKFLIKTASLKRWVSVCRFKIETWSQRKSLNVNNRNSRNFRITKIFYVKNFPGAYFKNWW